MSYSFNEKSYAQLLAQALPGVIETKEEYERIEKITISLFDKGEDNLSPEEFRLFGLLTDLLENYERRSLEHVQNATPLGALKYLMREHDLTPRDMEEFFGSQSMVSRVLGGHRAISRDAAVALGKRFHVSPAVFI